MPDSLEDIRNEGLERARDLGPAILEESDSPIDFAIDTYDFGLDYADDIRDYIDNSEDEEIGNKMLKEKAAPFIGYEITEIARISGLVASKDVSDSKAWIKGTMDANTFIESCYQAFLINDRQLSGYRT